VRLLGSVFVVPTDALAPLASDRGETGAPSDEDDWWNF
jgi:hypothetical protein